MELFYLIKIGKKKEVRSLDVSTFIERIRKMRALNNTASPIERGRYFIGKPFFNKKRLFFKDFD